MNVAEQVLHALQIRSPGAVELRQQIFHGVAEVFDADAKLVPGFGFFGAKRAAVEFGGHFVAFKSEALRSVAIERKQAEAGTEFASQLDPIFFVEACGAFPGVAFLTLASVFHGVENLRAKRIVGRCELQNPQFLYLRIANHAEREKKFAAAFAKFTPCGIWIDLFKYRGERAAAPQGDAEIVDGFFVRGGDDAFAFLEDAFHPIEKALRVGGSCRKGNDRSHGYLDETDPKPAGGFPEERESLKGMPAVRECPAKVAKLWKKQWKE